ncbi:MAG: glycosyltransferase family 29 protein [Candidatus Marinimicrobia bacterium]|nr:glycosyltransferase family 29 protein [Candidatus Neomarinimicrobiota bacterium]
MNQSLNQLPDFLVGHRSSQVIIIGNGPSAAAHELGQQIDAFDQIIRINNYVTAGMESKVGSQTDIWVNGANQGLKKRADLPKNTLVMIPPVVLEHKGEAIHNRIQRRLGTNQYFMVPLEIMQRMEGLSGIKRPTTGFFTIFYFYLLGWDVTLHGFDFFVGSTSHYFDNSLKHWLKDQGILRKAGKHNIEAEKTFVEELVSTGKIKKLRV